jgi:hypothetical protein
MRTPAATPSVAGFAWFNAFEGEVTLTHVGSCFCGAVKLEVTGAPEVMGY